jgi:hypothetical protein
MARFLLFQKSGGIHGVPIDIDVHWQRGGGPVSCTRTVELAGAADDGVIAEGVVGA